MARHRHGAFAVPVRDIVHRSGEMREITLDLPTKEKWGEGLVSVPEGGIIEIDARLESVHEGILVSATAETEYTGICGRCLIDIVRPLRVEIQELFAYPGDETSDFEVQDDHVDLETPVRDAIVLSLPFQPVCQPDCPGLDPATGVRLADNTDEEQSVPLDPRWAALQDYTTDHDDDAPRPQAGRGVAENTEKS